MNGETTHHAQWQQGRGWRQRKRRNFEQKHSKTSHKHRNSTIRSIDIATAPRTRVVSVIAAAHTQLPRQGELLVRCTHQTHPAIFKPLRDHKKTTKNNKTNSEIRGDNISANSNQIHNAVLPIHTLIFDKRHACSRVTLTNRQRAAHVTNEEN